MKLYKLEDRFDTKTGKLKDPIMVWTGNYLCDYDGSLIDTDDPEFKPQYTLTANYCHDSEEVYYYDAAKEWFEKHKIEYANLFNDPFIFSKILSDGIDCSFTLVKEWMDNFNNETSPLFLCSSIEEAMRISRVRTVQKILKEKKYTAQELGLTGLHLYGDRRPHLKDEDEID
jgi:hypothetical protein